MAYGKRIYGQAMQADTDWMVTVEVWEDSYTGAASEVLLSDAPVLTRMGNDGDKYAMIKGSEATITIAVMDGDDFAWLYTNDDRKFKVLIYVAASLKFAGYVVVDQYDEDFEYQGFISIIASDQLGLLDSQPYTFGTPAASPTGYASIISIIAKILSGATTTKTGLSLPIISVFNLFDRAMSTVNDTDDPLAQAEVCQNLWIGDDLSPASCKTVLEDLLTTIQCRLLQSDGFWWILHISELTGESIPMRYFNTAGVCTGDAIFSPQKITGTDVTVLADGSLKYESGWMQRNVEVDYGLKKSLVSSFDLPDSAITGYNPAAITGWTNTGTWRIILAPWGNVLMAATIAYPGTDTWIETPQIDANPLLTYQLSVKCGCVKHSKLATHILVGVVYWDGANPASKKYYNELDGTWDAIPLNNITSINFPEVGNYSKLTEQSVTLNPPPAAGKIYALFRSPYRGQLTSVDNSYYFSDVKFTASVDDESDKATGLSFSDLITTRANTTPDDYRVKLSDSVVDADIIGDYNGFLMVGSTPTSGWSIKDGGADLLPLVPRHDITGWTKGVITDSWYWQYGAPNRKFRGSFCGSEYGSLSFINTLKFTELGGAIFLLNDVEVDQVNNTVNGTFVELKPESLGDGSGALTIKSRSLSSASSSGSGLVPQPGGSDYELQVKSGGDFTGSTGITFDPETGRLMKGGALPLIEYRRQSATAAAGPQKITFPEAFLEADVFSLDPVIWGYYTDDEGQKNVASAIPYDITATDFMVDFKVPYGVAFVYTAMINR